MTQASQPTTFDLGSGKPVVLPCRFCGRTHTDSCAQMFAAEAAAQARTPEARIRRLLPPPPVTLRTRLLVGDPYRSL